MSMSDGFCILACDVMVHCEMMTEPGMKEKTLVDNVHSGKVNKKTQSVA